MRSPIARVRAEPLEPELRRLVRAVMFGTLLISVDLTVVNVALDRLGHDLHTSLGSTQWVVTAYALAIAATVPVTGWVGRRFGTRPVYIASLVAFTTASGLCAAAPSVGVLIVFRVIQGAAGGVLLPVGQTLLGHAAGPRRIGRVMGAVTSVAVISPIIGPTLGGLIVHQLSWRWIFALNLPVGAVAVALSARHLPSTTRAQAGPIDWIGFVLLTAGLPLVTYALAELGQGVSASSLRGWPALVAGILLVAAFVRHALRTPRPLLDLRLYRIPTFTAAAIGSALMGAAVFGPYLLMPLFYQDVQGATAFRAGLLFAPQGVGAAVAILLIAKHTDRLGGGLLARIGTVIMTLATIPFLAFDVSTSASVFVLVLVARGFGIGLAMVPFIVAALAVLPRESIADASPQLNMLLRVGSSVGTAILAVVLADRLRHATGAAGHAAAYHVTFAWVIALNAFAIVPAVALARIERRARAARVDAAVAPQTASTG